MSVVGEVATYAAMKSGLKDTTHFVIFFGSMCSNLCRDEKRTESVFRALLFGLPRRSNLCRDEKRTESLRRYRYAVPLRNVATYAAMKSGLKAYIES